MPEGNYLLDKINIEINDSTKTVDATELSTYIRQLPNHKMLWSLKFRLGVYNMSGKDSTKWYNKWIRKLGEAPVVYDSTLMQASVEQLEKAMVNKGFLYASVTADTLKNPEKKKIKVNYLVNPGTQFRIDSVDYVFPDSIFRNLVMADSDKLIVRPGIPLDRSMLETEREYIANLLKNQGYYGFSKEFITFNADTTEGSNKVDLTLKINPPYPQQTANIHTHEKYYINKIRFITNYDPALGESAEEILKHSTLTTYKDIQIYSKGKSYLRPSVLYENCFIREGEPYKQNNVDRTYGSLSRLGILKFVNIAFVPIDTVDNKNFLNAYILLTPAKSQSVSFELEGTNSEGDLGVAAAISYTHRNVGKGSETLTTKIRGAYESLSGDLEGLIHNRYME